MKMRSTFSMRMSWLSFLMLLTTSLTYAQSITIRGKVTDAKDQTPLPGVTVRVVNTTIGTSTVADGTFSLNVPNADAQLEFSYIGYETVTIPAGSNTTLNVQLKLSSKTLEDVVVVGYGTLKRKEITSAVTSIKAENFNPGVARSPMDLVQGKVPGLSITRVNGNNPNQSASVQMRGITTLGGAVAPLVVIDGVPGGNLDLLQQEDIASIDVLRDGSAAAIYGTRGTGGVILITTKKGRGGEPQYNFATYLQRETVAKRPQMLNADEFRKLSPANDLGGNTDIYDMLINKDNLSQYYTLSATGGTDKSNYRAAVYYNRGEGIAKRNFRNQYGGRLNVNQLGLQGKLSMTANLSANFNKADLLGGSAGDFEQAVQRNPTAPVKNPDGSYLQTSAFNNYNPIARLEQELSERDQQTIQGDGKVSLEIIKGLRASVFGAVVRNTWNDRQYRVRASQSSQQDYEGGGYAYKANRMELDQTLEATLDYNTTIKDDHTISAVGGYSYYYNTVETYNMNNSGFITDAFQDWNMENGLYLTKGKAFMDSDKRDYKLVAFFGRVNYSYKQKYFAQAILRHEGSSKFGANNKWANFPAFSLGWSLHEEDFLKGNRIITQLKLRGGYGVTGNSGFTSYNSLILLGTGGAYLQNGEWYQTFGPSRNPNPDLRWEKKKEWNLGTDFALFGGRLSGSFDVYQRKTEDLLYEYDTQLPPFVTSKIYTNVGSISNKGFEIVLSGTPVQTKNFIYSTDVTFNRQQNEMTSISNDLYRLDKLTFGDLPSPGNLGPAIRVVEGGPLGNFYGKRFAGFDESGNWLFYKKDGSKVLAGAITEDDFSVIGNGVPKVMFSWNNNLRYKKWDLTIFWRGKLGYDILNLQEMYFGNQSWLPNNVLRSALTKHANLKVPAQYSDYYLEPGGFVKLDNVALGYSFKFKNNYIRNLRVYAAGRNLVTITNYSGLDPELEDNGTTTGIDGRGFYPRTRSFTVGLNLGF